MKLKEWKMLKWKFTTKLVDKIDLIKLIKSNWFDKRGKKEKLKQLIWQSEIDKMKLIIEIDNTILKVGNWQIGKLNIDKMEKTDLMKINRNWFDKIDLERLIWENGNIVNYDLTNMFDKSWYEYNWLDIIDLIN